MSEDPIDEPISEAALKLWEEQVAKRAKRYSAKYGKSLRFSGVPNAPVTQALNKAIKSQRIRNVN